MDGLSCKSIVILILYVSQAYGSCILDEWQSSSSNDVSNDAHCEYSGQNYTIGSNWTLPFPDCLSCQCSRSGLECCGFGSAAGVIEPPNDCVLVKGTCEVRFVLKDNPSQPCDENDVITPMRRIKAKKFHTRRKNASFVLFRQKIAFHFK